MNNKVEETTENPLGPCEPQWETWTDLRCDRKLMKGYKQGAPWADHVQQVHTVYIVTETWLTGSSEDLPVPTTRPKHEDTFSVIRNLTEEKECLHKCSPPPIHISECELCLECLKFQVTEVGGQVLRGKDSEGRGRALVGGKELT